MEALLNKILDWLKRRFSFEVNHEIYSVSDTKTIDEKNLKAISFKNTGGVKAYVNSFPLEVGDPMLSVSVSDSGTDRTKYKITFENAVGTKEVWVIKQIKIGNC